MESTTLTIRIPKDLKKALYKVAEQERRKLSDFIRLELEKVIEQSKKKSK